MRFACWPLILIVDGATGAMTRRYVHGDQVDEPWVQYAGASLASSACSYLHADHQGSIIAHSNSEGGGAAVLAYDAYGIPAEGNIGRFGYTGQIWLKELGLFHYKARVYSPKLGRFLQADPIFYADQMNLYAYVGNDPVNMVDPKGKAAVSLGVQANVPGIASFIPGLLDESLDGLAVEGFQLAVTVSFPDEVGNGKWGVGASMNGVVGKEVGTEAKLNLKQNTSTLQKIGGAMKSLFKFSATTSLGVNWEKGTVNDVQNSPGDLQAGGHLGVAGGNVQVSNENNISGVELSVGRGLNIGVTVDVPMIGGSCVQSEGCGWTGN